MLEKLESSADNPSKTTLLENIESKIVDLQSLLRGVRDQRETGTVPQQAAPTVYGGRGGGQGGGPGGRGYAPARGRGRGYYPQYAGNTGYEGAGYAGRGRGYEEDGGRGMGGGRGRGRGRFDGRGAIGGRGEVRGAGEEGPIPGRTGAAGGGTGGGAAGGEGGSHPGFTSIDNRAKSLVVFQPPEGFEKSAMEHFSRLACSIFIFTVLLFPL